MDLVRIGEKLISYQKIESVIQEVLKLRKKGYSQREVSKKLGIDRSFISKIEKLGEIRKGGSIAVVGFPLSNKAELMEICNNYGVDYTFLLTEKERWEWVKDKTGEGLLNKIMKLCSEVRGIDVVVVIGSDYRINLIEALLDKDVIEISLGKSPIQEDIYLNPEILTNTLSKIT